MLGLGVGISKKTSIVGGSVSPSDISGLDVWFKVNTGITAASGNTSDAGNMRDGEDINSWDDQSGNDRHASQTSSPDRKPHWETDSADFGGLVWPDDTADTHLNMVTNVGGENNIEANEDFTIMIRVKLTDFSTAMGLIGSAAKEVIKWTDSTRVGVFIGGNNPIIEFDEGEDDLATDTYYIHTLTRKDGSTGNLTYHIHGGNYTDKFWNNDASARRDSDAFTLNNIGCAADTALPTEGVFKDVLVWKGTALSDSQRSDMYTYINGQDY